MKSANAAPEHYTTGRAISRDGTVIGYRQLGRGPGVVLLHGAMSSAHNHQQLAGALAQAFSVYVPDRRGRCRSGPFGDDYCMRKEVEDLDALLAVTGAQRVFGVSSGGLIVLEAALASPMIQKAALYEPALFMNRAIPAAALMRLDAELAEGRTAAALTTAMRGAQLGPAILRALPRRLLEFLADKAMTSEDKQAAGNYVPMRALAATLRHDFQLAVEMSGKLEEFRCVHAEVLLLGGSKSPRYLRAPLDALQQELPRSRRTELCGLGHEASWNSDRGGKPERVAQELLQFFA